MKLPLNYLLADNPLSRRQYLLAGRGATVLWAALEAIAAHDGRRGEVILPDMLCPSMLEAVLAAGFTPRFAEVNPETFSLTPETVQPLISRQTSAVIAVHLFGYIAPIEELASLLDGTGIRLIEDAVQAIGGFLPSGKPVGSCGDFSFVSFDPSKIIRGHGAILFYDDKAWTEFLLSTMTQVDRKAESPSDRLLNVSWRDLYHGLGQALRQGKMPAEEAARTFRSALPIYRPLLFRSFDDRAENLDIILQGWNTLPQRIKSRNANALALREAFVGFPVRCPSIRAGDAIWRYTVQFPSRETADRFVVALRDQGGLVSHLYYPLHQLFQPNLLLSTNKLSSRLVNLWVDENVDESYLRLVWSTAQALFSK
jgi:dTDP-4-amino-4,6-dideoxygalactose transaminase